MQITIPNKSSLRSLVLGHPLGPVLRLRWLFPMLTVALAACAAPVAEPSQVQLRERVTERWQALIAFDYAKAYSFATPAYRASVTPETYRGRQGVAIQRVSAEVFHVDCATPTQCKVRVVVGATPPLGKKYGTTITAPVDESWVYEEGQWWVVQRP